MSEVIIDGINVAECPFYQYQTPDDYKMKYPESGDCEIGMAGYLFDYDRINEELEKECLSNHNCHFKQLQRAKAENEKLKQALEEIRKIANEPCIEDEDCETCDSNCMSREIINKINEVLND